MPSLSRAQHGYAGMSSTAAGRATLRREGKRPMPPGVAREFLAADRGTNIARLAAHVAKARRRR